MGKTYKKEIRFYWARPLTSWSIKAVRALRNGFPMAAPSFKCFDFYTFAPEMKNVPRKHGGGWGINCFWFGFIVTKYLIY